MIIWYSSGRTRGCVLAVQSNVNPLFLVCGNGKWKVNNDFYRVTCFSIFVCQVWELPSRKDLSSSNNDAYFSFPFRLPTMPGKHEDESPNWKKKKDTTKKFFRFRCHPLVFLPPPFSPPMRFWVSSPKSARKSHEKLSPRVTHIQYTLPTTGE